MISHRPIPAASYAVEEQPGLRRVKESPARPLPRSATCPTNLILRRESTVNDGTGRGAKARPKEIDRGRDRLRPEGKCSHRSIALCLTFGGTDGNEARATPSRLASASFYAERSLARLFSECRIGRRDRQHNGHSSDHFPAAPRPPQG